MGVIGRSIDSPWNISSSNNIVILEFTQQDITLKIVIIVYYDNFFVKLNWIAPVNKRLEDCFLLGKITWNTIFMILF
jgi:hypothetical protein